jgi:TM2 domain-containing membrane protein YozV
MGPATGPLREVFVYSTGIAYLFWLLSGFGALGLHRFYLGKIPTGILWMCTGGLGMVGSLYDFFTLPGQVREANLRRALFDDIYRQYPGQSAARQNWRTVNDGEIRIVREHESVERVILKLAKANHGVLTASELALAANISVEEARRELDTLVNKGHAELRVRKSGTLVYTIPDLMSSDEPLEDF